MTGDLVFQVLQAIKPEIVSRIDSALRATRYPLGILRRSRVWESGATAWPRVAELVVGKKDTPVLPRHEELAFRSITPPSRARFFGTGAER
jgi:hypothetical protein